jgi:16S rRNA processing protein RimM
MPVQRPLDLVAIGKIADARGLRGEIKVIPFSASADALLSVRQWWLEQDGQWREVEVLAAKKQGSTVSAALMGWVDRDAALTLKGATVHASRSRFPLLDDGEYYWVDLIGLDVVNASHEPLGRVVGLMENGVHQILEVEHEIAGKKAVELIPFVDRHVKTVDRDARQIIVDWQFEP